MAVRMGQACGPKTTGAWGTTEWFPMLVKSSLALGCFPIMSGVCPAFTVMLLLLTHWGSLLHGCLSMLLVTPIQTG